MAKNRFRLVVLTLPVLLAIGCGGSKFKGTLQPRPSAPAIAYVLQGKTASVYAIDAHSGVLTPTTVETARSLQAVTGFKQMVTGPAGRFAYVVSLDPELDDDRISIYSVNSNTRTLTPATPTAFATGSILKGIAIDPEGKYIYTTNSEGKRLSMFAVDATTGVLSIP